MPPGMQSRIRAASMPSFNPTRWRTDGHWPNTQRCSRVFGGSQRTVLPAGASLLGEHFVPGNATPDIRFTLTSGHDVMAPVAFATNAKTATGSVALAWRSVPTETGYSAFVFGEGVCADDMVFWSSSEVSFWDSGADFIPPSEVARLVRERVITAPTSTLCAVPREAATAIKQEQDQPSGMLMFFAFGPDQNVVLPPRPTHVATPWNQQWAVKARFNAAGMQMLGQDVGAMMGKAGARDALPAAESQEDRCKRLEAERQAQNQNVSSAIGGMTGIHGGDILGGILGGQQKQTQSVDPNCPAPQR